MKRAHWNLKTSNIDIWVWSTAYKYKYSCRSISLAIIFCSSSYHCASWFRVPLAIFLLLWPIWKPKCCQRYRIKILAPLHDRTGAGRLRLQYWPVFDFGQAGAPNSSMQKHSNSARVTVVVCSAVMLIGAVLMLVTEDSAHTTSILLDDSELGKVIYTIVESGKWCQ